MLQKYIDETKEASLERILTDLTQNPVSGYSEVTYIKDNPNHRTFDLDRKLDLDAFLEFIRVSQSKAYNVLARRAPGLADHKLIEAFCNNVEIHGLIAVLKNGFDVFNIRFSPIFFKPEDDSNVEALRKYDQNKFFCARQFHYSKDNTRKSIDIVLLINGIPLVAIELKNNFSGQYTHDAVLQFCQDRDQSDLFFRLNHRCLVMFAVDNYTVEMTTKLDGMNTIFLPFNQGSNGPGVSGGAGNPVDSDNVPTHYLFDDILTKDSLQRIIGDYLVFDNNDKGSRVIFPRYHQLHCVEYLLDLAAKEGPKHNYLVQHSAGSGKSNTIAWLAFRLLYLQVNENSVYDSVLICVHRTVLNEQLNNTVSLFEYIPGMVATVNSSAELREAVMNGNKIIVTTLQKFGNINDSLKPFNRNFAIIFDEAHTNTTGRLNQKTKVALGIRELTAEEHEILELDYDSEEEILKAYQLVKSEGRMDNLSFYAFTATPKEKTLHAFGKRLDDGSYVAHHYYSMRQAIEEGYICDVLQDYTTYQDYFDIIQDMSKSKDVMVDKSKAMAIMRKLVRHDELVIKSKALVIMDYFRNFVENDLNGNAKAMLVVDGRDTVLQYRDALLEVCKEEGYDGLRIMVAFSGNLQYEEKTVTEQDFNFLPDGRRIRSSDMANVFDGPHFNFMIAADKFQVGFDQPKLTTMFVDKVLKSVEAVQTLSRLNRVIPGVQKRTHVLDFCNTSKDIFDAFAPYYEETESEEGYSESYVYVKREELMDYRVILDEDIKRFQARYNPGDPDFHKYICGLIEPSRDRFALLNDEDADKFRKMARSLERQYRSVTIATTFVDPSFHSLVELIHYLLLALPKKNSDPFPNIQEMISLDRYHLLNTGTTKIELSKGDALSNPRDSPVSSKSNEDLFEKIVEEFNNRWGLPNGTQNSQVAALKGTYNKIVDKISNGVDLKEFGDWTQESFKKQFGSIAKSALISDAMDNKEFFDALVQDPEYADKIVDSLLNNIRLNPDLEY